MKRGSKPSSNEVSTVYLHLLAFILSYISCWLVNASVHLLNASAHPRVFSIREAAIVRNRSLWTYASWISFHQHHIFPNDDLLDLFFPIYLYCMRAKRSTSNFEKLEKLPKTGFFTTGFLDFIKARKGDFYLNCCFIHLFLSIKLFSYLFVLNSLFLYLRIYSFIYSFIFFSLYLLFIFFPVFIFPLILIYLYLFY